MIILKVKEWLKNPGAQFRIEKRYDGNEIAAVTRLKDDRRFHIFEMICSADLNNTFAITRFSEDLVNVSFAFSSPVSASNGTCEINQIELNEKTGVYINYPTPAIRRPRRRVIAKKK